MENYYQLINSKLPKTKNDFLPEEGTKIVTFLNPYSYFIGKKNSSLYSVFNVIAFDGILPVFLHNLFYKKKTSRFSFDMTSLAPLILNYALEKNLCIFFIGSKEEEIQNFKKVVLNKYVGLNSVFRNGYFKSEEERDTTINVIVRMSPDIVVIGMGAPVQEIFTNELLKNGFKGSVYTCGGFIHQTQFEIKYYPKYINKLNIRFLYRIFKEKHILSRALIYIPYYIIVFFKNKITY